MKRLRISGSDPHGKVPSAPSERLSNAVTFDYLCPDSAQRIPSDDSAIVITALDAMGAAMVDETTYETDHGDANFPPIYTYWGQFIDHDITSSGDRSPVGDGFDVRPDDFTPISPKHVSQQLANLRARALHLDGVYGGGPTGNPSLYCPGDTNYHCCNIRPGAFLTGMNDATAGTTAPSNKSDLCQDLPRAPDGSGQAVIGDGRNDDNLIIAQFHLAIMRFHNAALDRLGDFEKARDATRLHYQWLVVNDYLKTIADPQIVDAVLHAGLSRYKFAGGFMPVEFSAAAFRFGHATIRSSYDFNENFGRGGRLGNTASFDQLFEFSGRSRNADGKPLGGHKRLPESWIADWSRLADRGQRFDDGQPERRSRKIDTHLAEPLSRLNTDGPDATSDKTRAMMSHLAQRDLRRGYLLSVPTGQAMAALAELSPLSASQLLDGTENGLRPALQDALLRNNELLLTHTPLWFYVLKEAEILGGGNHLGPVGSHIVVETIVGALRSNDDSFICRDWSPHDSAIPGGREIRSIDAFLQFAGVA